MATYTYDWHDLDWNWYQTDYNGKIPFKICYIKFKLPKEDYDPYYDHIRITPEFSTFYPYKQASLVFKNLVVDEGNVRESYSGLNYVCDNVVKCTFDPNHPRDAVAKFGTQIVGWPSTSFQPNSAKVAVPFGGVIGETTKGKLYHLEYSGAYHIINGDRSLSVNTPSYDLYGIVGAQSLAVFPPPSLILQFEEDIQTKGFHLESITNANLIAFYSGSPIDTDDPNPGDGDSHGGGGGGTDDLGGDPIKDTGVPTIEATDSGLMTLYNTTVSELQALGRFLWSDGLDLNSFKKLFNDPFDTLLGLSIIPIVPPTSGTKKIMFGNLDSGVSAKVISHQFVPNVDMGSITLGEVYNGALDYSPFTTVSIYLPFIGYRELNVQDVMNSKIHLVYKFDVLTGGCIAELYVDHLKTGNKSKDNSKFKWEPHSGLLASFEGQCAVNIPLASQDYTNTIRAMIGAVGMVGGAAASFATGNPALGVAALAVGSANSAMQASTPTVQRSGHLSSSNAIMANLTPFLTVTRPHQCKPAKYYKLRGVPSQIYVSKLSNLATSKHDYYLQVAEIPDIKVAGATDTEIAEIKNLLKEGVVL